MRSDGASLNALNLAGTSLPSLQLRADLQAAAAEAQALIPPPPTPYTSNWTVDPLDPPPPFAHLAAASPAPC